MGDVLGWEMRSSVDKWKREYKEEINAWWAAILTWIHRTVRHKTPGIRRTGGGSSELTNAGETGEKDKKILVDRKER